MTGGPIGEGRPDDQALGRLSLQPIQAARDGEEVDAHRQMLAVIFLHPDRQHHGVVTGDGLPQNMWSK